MPRLMRFARSTLSGDQLRLYDLIAGGPRASAPRKAPLVGADGALEGPFNAMLLSPEIGIALQELGSRIRYRSPLADRTRELAILVVAQTWDSEFERQAHEIVGRAVGLSESELSSVAAGTCPDTLSPVETAAMVVTQALARTGDLSDEEYAGAVDALGDEAVFALTTLVGYYATLAMQLRVYRVRATT